MQQPPITDTEKKAGNKGWSNLRIVISLVGTLLLFLFAIELMVSALQNLGGMYSDAVMLATANPFNGLFIGLLMTAMLQSSSTSTSLVVAFVASGSLSVSAAIPIVMGSNIGTTITSTIVSLGFINKRKEFRRAVAAGTYHDFFNILTVILLFPLEYYYGFLSSLASRLAGNFAPFFEPAENVVTSFSFGFAHITDWLIRSVPNPLFLAIFALVILFTSILIFRRTTSNLLKAGEPEAFRRFFFKNHIKSFFWGILTTAAIRSSTITTSVVVPIVAKKMATLRQAAPFILGANIGTTITAFIAVFLNATTSAAITIALVHLLFNLIGVLLFFPIPFLRDIPVRLANSLGRLTLRYRIIGFVYLLSTFFIIPFTLISSTRGSIQNYRLTYEKAGETRSQYYRINTYLNRRSKQGEWRRYHGRESVVREIPYHIDPVFAVDQTLIVGKEMFLFNPKGKCWDTEKAGQPLQYCVEEILPEYKIAGITFDSVFVFSHMTENDSAQTKHRYYYSGNPALFLQYETERMGDRQVLEKLISIDAGTGAPLR